jgi:hypothetical protein
MANPKQASLSRYGIVHSISLGHILAVLVLAGALTFLMAAQEGGPPGPSGIQGGPPKAIEDWRGNSASIRSID